MEASVEAPGEVLVEGLFQGAVWLEDLLVEDLLVEDLVGSFPYHSFSSGEPHQGDLRLGDFSVFSS